MKRFFFKVNGELHCPNRLSRPRKASDWEGGKVLIPASGPRLIGSRETASIDVGDEVWIWTHEDGNFGRGLGLTAHATADGISTAGEFIAVTLRDVQLLERPFGFRTLGDGSTGSRLLHAVNQRRVHDAYLIEDQDYPDFIAAVEEQSSPLPDDVLDEYLQGWDRELGRNRDSLLESLEVRRTAMLKARPMQRGFRDALFQAYSGCCVVSGCRVPEALEAAHIIPHNGDPVWDQAENGLLRRRDLHSLFDAFLWSVEPNSGSLHLSDRLRSTGYSRLEGRRIRHRAATELLRCHYMQFRKLADGATRWHDSDRWTDRQRGLHGSRPAMTAVARVEQTG